METNNFPDRIYLPRDVEYPQVPDIWWEREASEDNVEYIRTDAFIEKAVEFLEVHKGAIETEDSSIMGWIPDYFIEDFKNYMKGEEI